MRIEEPDAFSWAQIGETSGKLATVAPSCKTNEPYCSVSADSKSGSVAVLLFLDLGEELVDLVREVDPHEAAERAAPLPVVASDRRVSEPLCAVDADPHVPFQVHVSRPVEVAADLRAGQMGAPDHTERIPPFPGFTPIRPFLSVPGPAALDAELRGDAEPHREDANRVL